MICYHGYDHPSHCNQCPKEPQETRKRVEQAARVLRDMKPPKKELFEDPPLPEFMKELDLHDRAFQEANARESERLQKFIRELQEQLVDAQEKATRFNGRAVMQKLREIESKIDEGFGGG